MAFVSVSSQEASSGKNKNSAKRATERKKKIWETENTVFKAKLNRSTLSHPKVAPASGGELNLKGDIFGVVESVEEHINGRVASIPLDDDDDDGDDDNDDDDDDDDDDGRRVVVKQSVVKDKGSKETTSTQV